MGELFRTTPIWLLGFALLLASIAGAFLGSRIGRFLSAQGSEAHKLTENQEGYVVTSVYALLGLLVGFTFSVAFERYELRRDLVIKDANAIETMYLKSQLLEEPYRSTFHRLVIDYSQNHLELGKVRRNDARAARLLAKDDEFRREIWDETGPAFQSIKSLDFSASFVDSVNEMMNVDAERYALRRAEIPTTVLVILIFYSLVAAAVLGGVMRSRRGQQIGAALLALNVLALTLVIDINRPVDGTINESQEPVERMLARLKANPPPASQELTQAR